MSGSLPDIPESFRQAQEQAELHFPIDRSHSTRYSTSMHYLAFLAPKGLKAWQTETMSNISSTKRELKHRAMKQGPKVSERAF